MSDLETLLEGLSQHEQHAVQVVKAFIMTHNSMNKGDGDGLFSGIERYKKLAERLPQAAISSQTLFDFWSKLRLKMHTSMTSVEAGETLIPLWTLPNQLAILNCIVNQSAELVQIAQASYRVEADARKERWEEKHQRNKELHF